MASRINWDQHIEAWQGGGLTQAAYCRLHRLSPATFSAKVRGHKALPVASGLVPVKIEPSRPTAAEPLVLRTASGHWLELPASAEPHWVAELLRCLG